MGYIIESEYISHLSESRRKKMDSIPKKRQVNGPVCISTRLGTVLGTE